MKLSIESIVKLWTAIEMTKDREDLDFKFSYAVVKNKGRISSFIDGVKAMEKLSPKMAEFEDKRVELAKKYADKEAKQSATTIKIDEGKLDQFISEVKLLTEDYKEEIEANNVKQEKVKEYLKTQEEVDLFIIPSEYFPSKMSATITECFMPIIKEKTDAKAD